MRLGQTMAMRWPSTALHRTPAVAPLSPVSFQTLDDGRDLDDF
jgi:hypothetical protein